MSFLGRGGTGTVYQLSPFIAVKRGRIGEEERADHAKEQKTFELLEHHLPIPYLIRCYHRRPNDTFLELAPYGSIDLLLYPNQERKAGDPQVVQKVLQALNSPDICRWIKQLCLAVTALERIGLVHGDLHPGNMLVGANWNLKLCDFERVVNWGERLDY